MRFITLMVASILAIAGTSLAEGQLYERYIQGYHGPYRGRVIDAETKEPLAGAAVVAIWDRVKIQLLHSSTVFYDTQETLTDANGEFVIDAPDIEHNAPAQTLKPRFVIFTPGYASAQGAYQARGETIDLRRLRTRERRHDALLSPFELGAVRMDESNRKFIWLVPRERLQHFLRLINIERATLGLAPISY